MALAVQGFFFAAAAAKLRHCCLLKEPKKALVEGPCFLLPGIHSRISLLATLFSPVPSCTFKVFLPKILSLCTSSSVVSGPQPISPASLASQRLNRDNRPLAASSMERKLEKEIPLG